MRWEGDDRPPARWRRLAEGAWLLPRMWTILRRARTLGPEDGPPVLVIPGWAASDRTTRPLREALAEAGWRVHGWKKGFNRGAAADTVDHLRRRLDTIGDGRPVLVIGWSLGGVYARELARAARGLDEERDKAVELRCTHMAFAVSRSAAKEVVREVRSFLDEIDQQSSLRA
jgi:pimeloyl-ACP methyl ester carboxylesterase